MKNIFDLTKREQRLVIVIVTALVAATLAKHFWENRSQPLPARHRTSPSDWRTGLAVNRSASDAVV
jgi:hypothetical protein